MEQIDFLEQELKQMLENIERVKSYKKKYEPGVYHPCNSLVIGELKHRSVALKQRLTAISHISTNDIFN